MKYAAWAGFKEAAVCFVEGKMCFKDDYEKRAYEIRELFEKKRSFMQANSFAVLSFACFIRNHERRNGKSNKKCF